MIYEVFLDGKPLYYPNDEEAIIYNSKLEEELNDSGTFECTVPKTNPLFDHIYPRVSMVQILRDGKEIFYGQVRTYEEEFDGEKEMTCVGELAFLYDSIQPQERYQNQTPQQFFNKLVNWHNSQVETEKKFEPGIVTVTDPNNSIYRYTNYEDTLSDLRDKLCDSLEGYLRVRKADSKRYLDLVRQEDYGKYCDQPIKMGYNLLDYVKKASGEAIYTVLIPLGARLDESEVEGLDAYTNIKSVNDGKDYICNEEAIKKFGLVRTTQKWDDVTVPENLLRKGKQWLETNQYEAITLELTAVDMSMLNQNIDTFDLGDTIRVIAKPFGLDATYPVRKKTTYLQEPEKNTIVLSNTELSKSYTKKVQATLDDLQQSLPQEKTLLEMAKSNASQLIKAATEGNIFFINDEQGRPKEFLIMDQPDIDTAQKVWRWNMNGLGYSNTGYNGEYGLAITMDGQIVGERVTAHSISAEQLTVEYKKTLSEEIKTAAGDAAATANGYTDGQLENYYTTTTIDSKFELTDGAITNEVERAKKQEKNLSDAVNGITKDAKEFKDTVNGAFRDGIITESEARSIEKYIATMNRDIESAKKQYAAVVNSALQVSSGSGSNTSITFNTNCKTEKGSKNYDYISVYYKKDEKIYKALNTVNGEEIAGKTYILPSTDIYVEWHSDSSNCDYYGFSIDSMVQTATSANITGTESSLPKTNAIETYDATIICTPHPYNNNMDRLWHYKARTMTRDELGKRYNSYLDAYNELIDAINNAISDNEVTDDEKTAVDDKFTAYNNAFANLNEGLSEAGIDAAVISAYGVVDYAKASIKILSDQIESKVDSNGVESIIIQKADSIRLKADKIAWSSDNSSMTENGKLTCNDVDINGGKVRLIQSGRTPTFEVYDKDLKQGFTIHSSNIYGMNRTGSNTVVAGNDSVGFLYLYGEDEDNSPKCRITHNNITLEGSSGSGNYSTLSSTALYCTGSKHRVVQTQDFGQRLLCCYETPSPMFGDIGSGQIDDTGKCLIYIDEQFAQTIDEEYLYDVFLTKYGSGDCYVSKRTPSYFIVAGTKGLNFAWELKTIQGGYENLRLEAFEKEQSTEDSIYDVSAYMNTLLYKLN